MYCKLCMDFECIYLSTAAKFGLEDCSPEVAAMISHATEERLKNLLEKLSVIAEHRLDVIKVI